MTMAPLPADITGTIDNLVQALRGGRTPSENALRAALENLVHTGVNLGESRQSARHPLQNVTGHSLEIRNRPTSRDTDDGQTLPADACRAVFDAPRIARDARTLAPCHLPQGHTGSHTNAKGVSWGTRDRNNPTTTRRTPMPGRTDAQRRELMRQHQARMNAQQHATPARSTTGAARRGFVEDAQHTLRLAQDAPYGGFLPSQIAKGMRELERVGSELLLRTKPTGRTGAVDHAKRAELTRRVSELRTAFAPGRPAPVFNSQELTDVVRVVRAVLEPFAEREKLNRLAVNRRAIAEELSKQPEHAPAAHPWTTTAA